ncbi:MAG TPA: SDR family NAD(P)-dependent oxidoreductase, partial [Bacteroidia bacterium]|nr:SDR family NAD(P)-dependent oxidoreductase [Bacteroidia bacterium]
RRLVKDHFLVLGVDTDQTNGAALETEFGKQHVNFFFADICREQDVQNIFSDCLKRYKQVDLVVNNAGIIRDNLIWNMSVEEFDAVINVNLKGTWLMCREAATVMKAQKYGRIVNIASRAWLGNRGQSNYSASKAGIVSLTRVLALELGKYNVFVNTVAPGLIDTSMTQKLEKAVLEKLIQSQPSKTMGKPEDVANAVAFLANPETEFINGQTLYVDGGKSIGANF